MGRVACWEWWGATIQASSLQNEDMSSANGGNWPEAITSKPQEPTPMQKQTDWQSILMWNNMFYSSNSFYLLNHVPLIIKYTFIDYAINMLIIEWDAMLSTWSAPQNKTKLSSRSKNSSQSGRKFKHINTLIVTKHQTSPGIYLNSEKVGFIICYNREALCHKEWKGVLGCKNEGIC